MKKRKKIALIFGVTGQDGSFMAKHMTQMNHSVHGVVRKSSTGNLINIKTLNRKFINKNFKNILNVYIFHIGYTRHNRSIYNESISKDWWNI